LGSNGTKLTAIGEGEVVGCSCQEGTANIELGIGSEDNAVGVEQKEVGGTLDPQGSQDIGGIAASDAAENVLNACGIGKSDFLSGVDIEVLEALLIVAMKFVLRGALRAPLKTNFIAGLSNAVLETMEEVNPASSATINHTATPAVAHVGGRGAIGNDLGDRGGHG
jgi:hypothetical protein